MLLLQVKKRCDPCIKSLPTWNTHWSLKDWKHSGTKDLMRRWIAHHTLNVFQSHIIQNDNATQKCTQLAIHKTELNHIAQVKPFHHVHPPPPTYQLKITRVLAVEDAFPTCLVIVTIVKVRCKEKRSCWWCKKEEVLSAVTLRGSLIDHFHLKKFRLQKPTKSTGKTPVVLLFITNKVTLYSSDSCI